MEEDEREEPRKWKWKWNYRTWSLLGTPGPYTDNYMLGYMYGIGSIYGDIGLEPTT